MSAQATIVRVMKARKTLAHNDLIGGAVPDAALRQVHARQAVIHPPHPHTPFPSPIDSSLSLALTGHDRACDEGPQDACAQRPDPGGAVSDAALRQVHALGAHDQEVHRGAH